MESVQQPIGEKPTNENFSNYKKNQLNKLFHFCQDVQFQIIEKQLMSIENKDDFDQICETFLSHYDGCQVHEGIELEYKDRKITIDTKIANLIWLIWRKGIETIDSCEGYNHNCDTTDAYIVFKSKDDLDNFIKIISTDDSKNGRLYREKYKVFDYDYNDYGLGIIYQNPQKFQFPQDDIIYLSELIVESK